MIPFVDLKLQYQNIRGEILAAVEDVFASAAFALGPAVADFEQSFADYTNTKHAVAVNSGTSALHLALLAAGVGAGDEVIVPAMSFIATMSAVDYVGAKPVLVDIDPVSYTIDPKTIPAALTKRTKAILPVHLYGQSADMDAIKATVRNRGVTIIEDAAQAHGAEYKGQRCGSLGDLAAFSFYPGKNLGAYGEGGAVVTDRADLAETVRLLRDWGQKPKGNHVLKAFNYRMAGVQGAILGVKMKYIERWTDQRRRVAATYARELNNCRSVTRPTEIDYARHVYHVYAIRVAERDAVRTALEERDIGVGVHYPVPMHRHPCFAELGYKKGDFPVAEQLAAEELSLPVYAELADEHIRHVCRAIKEAVRDAE